MDKKNTIIGVALLAAAFALLIFGPHPAPQPSPSSQPLPEAGTVGTGQTAPAGNASTTTPPPVPATAPDQASFAAVSSAGADATITKLANDKVEVRLTDLGGAVDDVAFKDYPATQDSDEPYVFNDTHADPILGFTADTIAGLSQRTHYTLVSATPTEAVYRTTFENRIEVTRRYTLKSADATPGDPYVIHHETTFRNISNETTSLPRAGLSVGTAALVSAHDSGIYLNTIRYDGKDAHYTDRSALEGGGFLKMFGAGKPPVAFIDDSGPTAWAAVKNQFFASIYVPEQAAQGLLIRRVELPALEGSARANVGLTASIRTDVPALAPGATATLAGDLYVGPKEYHRLAALGNNQDRVMQYDRFFFNRIFLSHYLAPAMNTLMTWMHSLVGRWGWAIVLMTLLLKLVSLPFTLAASRSAKRMQKLQPLMKEVREKYKDDPKKLNEATIALFKEHKINPAGGCLPMFITMPLFIAFFAMLMGSAELRFQPFLWAHDLSAPDTVGHLFGVPINIMPLLMGATMLFQMRLSPTPTADGAQATMMKVMPLMFMLFCYNYSCALALYSTINGLFTIGQQLVINKTRDPLDDATAGAAAAKGKAGKKSGAPMKNVTPGK